MLLHPHHLFCRQHQVGGEVDGAKSGRRGGRGEEGESYVQGEDEKAKVKSNDVKPKGGNNGVPNYPLF